MISQESFKGAKRRLAIAEGRFVRARRELPNNPWSREADPALLPAAIAAAERLREVAADGLDLFAREGYPDSWARWESAGQDAAAFLRRWEGWSD